MWQGQALGRVVHAGEHVWYILAEHRWCIFGEHAWYIFGEHPWRILGEHQWYIYVRLLTQEMSCSLENNSTSAQWPQER